jgi:two-component system chemotaxis response regulator CheB
MPAAFTSQFSAQLSEVSALPVKEAVAGELIEPGVIYVCPGSRHLRITARGRIALDDGERVCGYLPCADITLESVAQIAGPMTVGVILTGMGNDGTKGALAVRAAGGYVIAQDEATSVIFGMPAEAAKAGAVHEVLPIDDIASAIERSVSRAARLVPEAVR